MKKFFLLACTAILSMAAVSPCLAADSLFNGTWKPNEAKSKLTGGTFTYTMKADGTYHYSNGSITEYDFACDGKGYPAVADRTITCTGEAAAGFDFTWMANGTVLSKSHETISADGKTMTSIGTSMHADGTTAKFEDSYKRLSGTTGMAGKWKDVKDKVSGASVMVISVSGDMIHLEFAANRSVRDCKLDGSDCPVTGPHVPQGTLNSYKLLGPAQISYDVKYKDKVKAEGIMTVSADGKALSDESWTPGKKAEKTTMVFDK